jgi:beta-xylosidase
MIDASAMSVPSHYENDTNSYGAMKIFFDPVSGQFMITWHASLRCYPKGEWHWKSMRTFYVLTKDFKTFTKAERLLDFDGPDKTMAQLDATVHYIDGLFYVLVKDERKYDWLSTEVEEDRVPRIARSRSLTGPYTDLSNGLTPEHRGAPVMVRALDGKSFMLYAVNAVTGAYELYTSENVERRGPWEQKVIVPPADCANGCVLTKNEETYKRLSEL